MQTKTTYMDTAKTIHQEWHVIDAKNRILGEIAVEAARFLSGKHKPTFTPHIDNGDFVVVINAKEVAVTGNKAQDKTYYRHSGFPGGFREEKFADLLQRNPAKIIEEAVKGMLPKNKLHTQRMRRLKVVAGSEHNFPVAKEK